VRKDSNRSRKLDLVRKDSNRSRKLDSVINELYWSVNMDVASRGREARGCAVWGDFWVLPAARSFSA